MSQSIATSISSAFQFPREQKLSFSFRYNFSNKPQVKLLMQLYLLVHRHLRIQEQYPLHRTHTLPCTLDIGTKNANEEVSIVRITISDFEPIVWLYLDVLNIEYMKRFFLLIEWRFSNLDSLFSINPILDNVLEKQTNNVFVYISFPSNRDHLFVLELSPVFVHRPWHKHR